MPVTVRLALADEHNLFRKTLVTYLSEQTNLLVVSHASNISDLLFGIKGLPVDVLLMDIHMGKQNGIETVRMIRERHSGIRILALSDSVDMDLASDALEAGVHGVISKSDEPEQLLQAIRLASEGRIYRNKLFTEALYWNKQHNLNTYLHEPATHLNDRDKRIIQLLWQEKSNKEIAEELFLGIRSIEKIRQDLKEKIGVESTIGILKYGILQKIIQIHAGVSKSTL